MVDVKRSTLQEDVEVQVQVALRPLLTDEHSGISRLVKTTTAAPQNRMDKEQLRLWQRLIG